MTRGGGTYNLPRPEPLHREENKRKLGWGLRTKGGEERSHSFHKLPALAYTPWCFPQSLFKVSVMADYEGCWCQDVHPESRNLQKLFQLHQGSLF